MGDSTIKLFSLIFREILGLFIDDELLALGILAVVAGSAMATIWSPAFAGAILLLGSLLAVTLSLSRPSESRSVRGDALGRIDIQGSPPQRRAVPNIRSQNRDVTPKLMVSST